MGNKLYLECQSGISGDMTVASLIDLGGDVEGLKNVIASLGVDGFEIKVSRVSKSGIDCADFDVILDEEHQNYDHDMEYLHGFECEDDREHEHHHHHHHHHDHEHHEHHHEHKHHHEHEHHDHEHYEHHHEHHHEHEHRGLAEINTIISHAAMSGHAKDIAYRIFDIIAEAEAKAHGTDISEVHFHEVGAIDSIVDIISVAYLLDNLDIDEVIVPYLCEGTGTVRCAHGVLPVPVPAVTNIVASNNINLQITSTQGELVTPTGAAIVAAIKTSDTLPSSYRVLKTGMGAGKRNYERPSILRSYLIEEKSCISLDTIMKLETNIDDCTAEHLGFVMEKLMAAGARDVYFVPAYMKKCRPAYVLNVICREEDTQALEEIIFENTTTIGIRKCLMERHTLDRSAGEIETPLGKVSVKKCVLPSGTTRVYPEYESMREIAFNKNIPYEEVRTQVLKSL